LERVTLIPRDLDLIPFIDAKDTAVLKRVRAVMRPADWECATKGAKLDLAA
jgi:hypothetical protein